MSKRRNQLLNIIWAVLGVAILVLAFMAYLRPAFVVDLANRFFLCF